MNKEQYIKTNYELTENFEDDGMNNFNLCLVNWKARYKRFKELVEKNKNLNYVYYRIDNRENRISFYSKEYLDKHTIEELEEAWDREFLNKIEVES